MDDITESIDIGSEERFTIIVPSLNQAALEVHRQNMWEKGYRLENSINGQKYFQSDGRKLSALFDGKAMYAITFVKR